MILSNLAKIHPFINFNELSDSLKNLLRKLFLNDLDKSLDMDLGEELNKVIKKTW